MPDEPIGGSDLGTPPPLPPPPAPPGRTGPPWEHEGPVVNRFIDTARGVLLDPQRFYTELRREGGLGQPLIYALVGGLLGAIAGSLYQIAFGGLGFMFGNIRPRDFAVMPFWSVGYLFIAPILITIWLFLVAGIYHLGLMLLSAARHPFEATFRVVCYTGGSTALLGIVPFCGGLIAFVWGLVASVIGLAAVQECSTGKALATVLIPMVLCCGLAMMFGVGIAALIGGLAALGSQ